MLVVLTNGLESFLLRKGLHTSVGLASFVVVLSPSTSLFVGWNRRLSFDNLVVDEAPKGLLSINMNSRVC